MDGYVELGKSNAHLWNLVLNNSMEAEYKCEIKSNSKSDWIDN